MSDNRPIYGCDGCNTTGGRASCPIHRGDGTGWLGDSFAEVGRLQAEIERLQGLLAAQDREYNAENLRAERFKRERDEARRALGWYFTFGCIHGPIPKEFDEAITAGFAAYKVSLESVAARTAEGGEDE